MRTYLILFLLFSFNINADELDVFFEALNNDYLFNEIVYENELAIQKSNGEIIKKKNKFEVHIKQPFEESYYCLLYTSPSPRDKRQSRMPSSA